MHYSHHKTIAKPKRCSECPNDFTRNIMESNSNWRRRKTCSTGCRFERQNRLKREKRLSLNALPT